ncbi:Glycoside hydrolase family 61 [Penicillium cf. griseofulvum]|uniref:AA9 family lytic polysaccharide monooxygenase n=1 Tax=Penicillium cf. griseofulvum TaxID=2972120 RepID=A0A9W9J1K4_9EURO|nr:Glycoside hydrolase family 61 [Penicillium cf. griseofulvum]KAJ5434726.1 Glycoside hydrolase family 61 [Penicillium cf. griseofulvum]
MLTFLRPALFASLVAAHGHVTNIVINGVSFDGWDIGSYPYTDSPPDVVAWGTPNTSNGFVAPDAYGTSDIICHLEAKNAKGHAVVAAGDRVFLQWTPNWPESHHGPIIDYLASCGASGCETVDKNTLKFFKIDGVGLVDGTSPPGLWADDQLIAQNSGWMVEIPANIAPGHYVLRHEMIALHGAGSEGGAQNYPQCFNLQITGSGTDKPAGVLGTDLYSPTDPGILVDIYKSLASYVVPGPTLYSGAVSITQTTSAITASGTPITGTGGTGGTDPAITSKTTTTTLATTTLATTTKPNTTSKATTTTAGGGGATQTPYGQCGGSGWTGPTACAPPAACSSVNQWYSQCLPTGA